MNSKDFLIQYTLSDICEVDVSKVCRNWDKNTRIMFCFGIYRLYEYTKNNRKKYDIRISEADALTIIEALQLESYPVMSSVVYYKEIN